MSAGHFCRTFLGVCSIALLASCDAFLPPRRQAQGTAAEESAKGKQPAPVKRTAARSRGDSAAGAEAQRGLEQIRRSLRRLVVAEQGFFAETGVYTQDLSRLAFKAEGETELRFLWLDREGYAVRGTHPKLRGKECVIFVGVLRSQMVAQRYGRAAREGMPLCDLPPRSRVAADTSPPAPVDTTSAVEAASPSVQMKVDLRKMIQAQDAYYATMGGYTARVSQLPIQFLWNDAVSVSIVSASRRSWTARATHARWPGKSCVIWFGAVTEVPTTQAQRRSPKEPGTPVCDD